MRTAMISYNTFVKGEGNGWKDNGDNHVLLLQNSTGATWGTSQVLPQENRNEQWKAEATALLDPLWAQLQNELPTLDAVIMYVGSVGAEHVIELAAKYGLTPDRAIFVRCDCNLRTKMEVIRSCGFASSRIVDCECGGHGMMSHMYRKALDGHLN